MRELNKLLLSTPASRIYSLNLIALADRLHLALTSSYADLFEYYAGFPVGP